MASSMNSKARSLTARTVHLKVHPIPRTFAEQREVLRVIERFGEVSVFKSLKYEPRRPVPNAFLAVFNTVSSAEEIINVSPLRYNLISETTPSSTTETPEDDAAKSTFEVRVSETLYDHQLFLNSPTKNPLHGPYVPVSPKTSYIAGSLSKIVPDSNWSDGLMDWDTEKSRWRNDDILAPEEERRYRKDGEFISEESSSARGIRLRTQTRTPRVMSGLQALWRERVEKAEMELHSEENLTRSSAEDDTLKLSE
ncbi:uncharacterized protein RAG0_15372 [Rhynchosporium agropyri]|uniref:Uncharacterized protein n=1 Tax=Rhynchosporium agropyri TaxID=914238 RepID=A0A1E1LKW0_9HELO|nr:uncharacterized protein RAG0_15372 [Rhynchosporium agropyri]